MSDTAETVQIDRERILRLLFSVQEVLPYAMDAFDGQTDGTHGVWNTGVEGIMEDVYNLRLELRDETLGP